MRASFTRRPPLAWLTVALVLAIAAAVLLDAVVMPQPWKGIEHRLLLEARWPEVAAFVLLLAAGLGLLVQTSPAIPVLPDVAAEEPRLNPPRLAVGRSEVKVVTVIGLEPGSGVTTLAFNVAVSLAASGEKSGTAGEPQPVRPACLLAEGPLTTALGLSPLGLEEQLAERPWEIRSDVVRLGVRHSSGCVLFCLRGGSQLGDGVRWLVAQLRRHYDAIFIDGAVSQAERYFSLDQSDLYLLVALPVRSSVEPAGRWIERVWGTSRETATVMVVNRVPEWPPPPRELILAFHHLVLLPDDPHVAAFDRRGLSWGLDDRSAAASQLTELTGLMFPTMTSGGDRRAA